MTKKTIKSTLLMIFTFTLILFILGFIEMRLDVHYDGIFIYVVSYALKILKTALLIITANRIYTEHVKNTTNLIIAVLLICFICFITAVINIFVGLGGGFM